MRNANEMRPNAPASRRIGIGLNASVGKSLLISDLMAYLPIYQSTIHSKLSADGRKRLQPGSPSIE
jgi:hypothetical protein